MLASNSMNKTLEKLERLCRMLYDRIFVPVGSIQNLRVYETKEALHRIPDDALFSPVSDGQTWGGDSVYGWFRGEYTIPSRCQGQALYLRNRIGAYEATLWVNGRIHSNFAAKYVEATHGNHYCNRICEQAAAGETLPIAMECYAYHDMPGWDPFSENEQNFTYSAYPPEICLRDEMIADFVFDLKTLLSLRRDLPEQSFRRAEIDNALFQVHETVFYDSTACTEGEFRQALKKASICVKEQLSRKNSGSAPWVGLIGHSHMDTAWLWPIRETEKKCARTYANQLNLMKQYPEYKFVQSSAYHGDMIRRNNPELFRRIQQAAAEGRYEPNGGVWVECDCNLIGGEYLIRQFVWGQKFTQKYFHFTSDCFWLPDTFGYSPAIPQIMKGCGVSYFLTTKMAWNDTNTFPYTSFYWEGLDGTRVLTHLNRTHIGPSPQTLREITVGADPVREKRVSDMRLFSFGKGDGGGGPEFEELEMARRLSDLEGVPRSGYQTVSRFMHDLEKTIHDPSVYADELYLELHRGTLTNQAQIKRNNRDCEIALHDLELVTVLDGVRQQKEADGSLIRPLMNDLLVRQFHDILPGTCIQSAHEEAKKVVGETIRAAREQTEQLLHRGSGQAALLNPLSFDRRDTLHLPLDTGEPANCEVQTYTDLFGEQKMAVYGLKLPAFSSVTVSRGKPAEGTESPFILEGNRLQTPFDEIRFDDNGGICSMVDRRTGRELVGGLPFNTFLMAENVPALWDNWDLDADEEGKFKPSANLLSRRVVSCGPVELRIRSKYALSEKSQLRQDMVLDAHTHMITFETLIDWQEEHRFLKTAFDTSLHCDGVRNEIQFGYIRRSNHRSTEREKARFEVCNHKYSDLSENSYGIALLNDCKYGISARDGSLRLSLHKGGMRPDRSGDKGRNYCRYAIVCHDAPFGAESVVRPAYTFNYPPILTMQGAACPSLVQVGAPNVVIETVKPCEETQRAYILRLYEAAGDYVRTELSFGHPVKKIYICSMLEEEIKPLETLELRPFQILTLKVYY